MRNREKISFNSAIIDLNFEDTTFGNKGEYIFCALRTANKSL